MRTTETAANSAAGGGEPQPVATTGVNTRRHAKFAKPLRDYQEIYGSGTRSIKRWVALGKKLRDIPPLDAPAEMAAWWNRCMDHQTPDKLLALVRPDPPVPPSPPAAVPVPGTFDPWSASQPAPPRDFSNIVPLDIEANVAELRRTLAINKFLLDDALVGADDNQTTLRQRNYERSFELLRKAEQTLLDLQKARGTMIERDAVAAELAQLLDALRLMHDTQAGRIVRELEQILPRRYVRILAVLKKFLSPAIERTRAGEAQIFRNLESLENSAATSALLTAA